MKITFLGTSSGKVSPGRYHSSLLFSFSNYNLLIDAGDGISRALINSKVDFNSVNGILFTHLHPDHFSGLPALVVQMKMIKRVEPLDIFIHESLVETVKDSLIRTYLFPEKLGFKIHYKDFKDNRSFSVAENFSVLPRKNMHLKELEKYQTNYSSISFYSASFLFECAGKKIIYTSDIGSEEDLLLFSITSPDLLISELTHISLNSLLKIIGELKPLMTYLTHFADEEKPSINEILTSLPNFQKVSVRLAQDGLSYEI